MKSNVCIIEKGTKDLAAILKESEKVAVYNELDQKQTLHLRLLCEELDGMLPEIVGDFKGNFWIEFEDGVCNLNVSIKLEDIDSETREKLLDLSKNKQNAAAVGIVGKIRSVLESVLLDPKFIESLAMSSGSFGLATGYSEGVDYSYLWTLEKYKNSVKEGKNAESWDELEKSVIASVADDVKVGVKGSQVDIVIVKKF